MILNILQTQRKFKIEIPDHSLPKFCTRDIYGLELTLP
jgi:hypothetical protein